MNAAIGLYTRFKRNTSPVEQFTDLISTTGSPSPTLNNKQGWKAPLSFFMCPSFEPRWRKSCTRHKLGIKKNETLTFRQSKSRKPLC